MNLRCIQGSLYNSTEAWVLNTEHAFLAHRAHTHNTQCLEHLLWAINYSLFEYQILCSH